MGEGGEESRLPLKVGRDAVQDKTGMKSSKVLKSLLARASDHIENSQQVVNHGPIV